MACIVMAYTVMAYTVMAYTVMTRRAYPLMRVLQSNVIALQNLVPATLAPKPRRRWLAPRQRHHAALDSRPTQLMLLKSVVTLWQHLSMHDRSLSRCGSTLDRYYYTLP